MNKNMRRKILSLPCKVSVKKMKLDRKRTRSRKTFFNPSVPLSRSISFEAERRDSRGAESIGDFLLCPMDAEPTPVCGFISERLLFEQENETCCVFVSPSLTWVL